MRPATPFGTEWLDAAGIVVLPSGRRLLVGEREESWVTLELDDGIRIVVDLDEPESAYLSLHRARTGLDGPPATRPYHCEATVLFGGSPDALVIRDIPFAAHQRRCEHCPPDHRSAFSAPMPVDRLTACLDVLSRFPVRADPWSVPATGAMLWRGRIDGQGRALIELFADDELLWDDGIDVVDHVDLGLDRWAAGATRA